MRHPEEIGKVAGLCKDNGRMTVEVAGILLRERFSSRILFEVLPVIYKPGIHKMEVDKVIEPILIESVADKYKGQLIDVLTARHESTSKGKPRLNKGIKCKINDILHGELPNPSGSELEFLKLDKSKRENDLSEGLELYVKELEEKDIYALMSEIDEKVETVPYQKKLESDNLLDNMAFDLKLLESLGIDREAVLTYSDQPESAEVTAPQVCEDDQP